jgi:hypothetical protein
MPPKKPAPKTKAPIQISSSEEYDSESYSEEPVVEVPAKKPSNKAPKKEPVTEAKVPKKEPVVEVTQDLSSDDESSSEEVTPVVTKAAPAQKKTNHVETPGPCLIATIHNDKTGLELKLYEFHPNRDEYSYFTEYVPEAMNASFSPGLCPGSLMSDNIVFQHNKVFYIKIDSFHRIFKRDSHFMMTFYASICEFVTTSNKIDRLLLPEIMVNCRKENPDSKFNKVSATLIEAIAPSHTHFAGIYYNVVHDVLMIVGGVVSAFNDQAQRWMVYETMHHDDYIGANPVAAIFDIMNGYFPDDRISRSVFKTNDCWFMAPTTIQKLISMAIMAGITTHSIPKLKGVLLNVIAKKESILAKQAHDSAIDEDIPADTPRYIS